MRAALLILIGIQVLAHLLGLQLVQPIPKAFGMVWFAILCMLLLTGVLYALRSRYWWATGMITVLISQILVIYFWKTAWFLTIGNALLSLAVIYGYADWDFKNLFRRDVWEGVRRTSIIRSDLLTASDLQDLPILVQKYLRYTGAVNKPKVNNVRITFEAAMRKKEREWFRMTSVQYNFFDRSGRLFFLNAVIRGLPVTGYHRYKNSTASMLVKLLSLFPVSDAGGEEMYEAETVTVLNDMCVFAPATLIDKRIHWESLDNKSVKAIFSNPGVTVSAILHFNDDGQLVNFVSDDRYDVTSMKKYRFSTPLGDYREIKGLRLCHYGEAIWHYPEGSFTYGSFILKDIEYNLSGL
jgi:hypothetical protein